MSDDAGYDDRNRFFTPTDYSSMPPKKQQDLPKNWGAVAPMMAPVSHRQHSPERSKSNKKARKSSGSRRETATPPNNGRKPPSWAQVQTALDSSSKKELKALLAAFPQETVSLQHENGMSALHFACSGGMLDQVQLLVEYGARVNAQDEDGWTPLHFACQAGSSAIVALLLANGARPTIVNSIEQTALHVAASNGRREVVSVLLDSEAGKQLVGMLDGNGATPLLWAACAGNADVVRLLVERGQPELVARSLTRSVDSWGGGVLGSGANAAMVAALNGFPRVMDLMLEAGVRIACTDAEGRNVLHYAALCSARPGGAADVIAALMRHPEASSLVEVVDENGNTAIHLAAMAGDVTALEALQAIMSGDASDRWAKNNFLGCNVLHCVALSEVNRDHREIVNYVLERDKRLLTSRDNRGQTPLHCACSVFNISAASAMLAHPLFTAADAVLVDHRGRTPLHVLCTGRDSTPEFGPTTDLVDHMLIKNPALLTATDAEGNTPLHAASAAGNRAVLRALLTNELCGAPIIALTNRHGMTPRQVTQNVSLNRLFYPSNRTRIRAKKRKSSSSGSSRSRTRPERGGGGNGEEGGNGDEEDNEEEDDEEDEEEQEEENNGGGEKQEEDAVANDEGSGKARPPQTVDSQSLSQAIQSQGAQQPQPQQQQQQQQQQRKQSQQPIRNPASKSSSSKSKKKRPENGGSALRKRTREEEMLGSSPAPGDEEDEDASDVKSGEYLGLLKFMRGNLKERIEVMRDEMRQLDNMIRRVTRK